MGKLSNKTRGATIGMQFVPPYANLFMADLKEKMLEIFWKNPTIWWRYINDIFFIWKHGEESLSVFIDQVNLLHPTIKFTAEYSKEAVIFLDWNI